MGMQQEERELEAARARIALLENEKESSEFFLSVSRRLLDIATDAVFYTDASFRLIRGNLAFEQLLGPEGRDMEGKDFASSVGLEIDGCEAGTIPEETLAVLARSGHWEGEVRRRNPRGETRIERLILAAVPDGKAGIRAHVGILRDVSELRSARAILEYSANHDSLTGLPNREAFHEALAAMMAGAGGDASALAVCVLDLDDFKRINNDLSRDLGDCLLRAVGRRLSDALRAGDLLARSGGDEFSLAFPVKGAEEVRVLAARTLGLFDAPFEVGGRLVYLSATMGVALCPEHGTEASRLSACADLALQSRKLGDKRSFAVYREDLGARLHGKAALTGELRAAIGPRGPRSGGKGGRFYLDYQPIVDIATGQISGTEALARWDHPERGRIPPLQFIPLAEESGLIVALGGLVLRTACAQARAWLAESAEAPRIAVNVSVRQLQEPGFVDEVARAVDGLPRDRITLEITETQLFEDLDGAAATLLRLKDLGVLLSVDDFGTGYASLSYLRRLPVDTVKIDQSFVADIERNRHDRRIVEAVTTLSTALGARTVAEGVETGTQLELLRDLGCDYAQGYLFSPPVAPELILGLQRGRASRP